MPGITETNLTNNKSTEETMKKSILFAAFAAATLLIASCDKTSEYPYPAKVETVSTVPDIIFTNAGGVNLYDVPANVNSIDIVFNTNVPVISDVADNVSGYGMNFNPKGVNTMICEEDGHTSTTKTGRIEYAFGLGSKPDYTIDAEFFLVQSAWNQTWYDYVPYGYIETPATFRVRGAKGTAILPEDYETYAEQMKEKSRSYFLSGEILSIEETSMNALPFATIKHYESIFKEINFTPSSTALETEGIVLKVDTGEGVYDVTVIARKRDNEKIKLLSYVGVGDVIEVPAVISSEEEKAFKERGYHANIKAVTADKILKIGE